MPGARPARKLVELSPADPTLDAVPAAVSAEISHRCQRVELIQGSGPHITGEIASLLRVRLRAAALSLFIGFGIVFTWRTLRPISSPTHSTALFYMHFAIDVLLGGSAIALCQRCSLSLRTLRVFEVLIFGLPALFMVLMQHESMCFWATKGFLQNSTAPWYALIFTYALFIPNHWRRAAVVLSALAAAPLCLVVYEWFSHRACTDLLHASPGYVAETAIMMSVGLITSVYGTYMIGALRQEAFEARQLGQYKLLRMIGSGGMGEVYLAEHQMMKRPCAIKLIRPGKATDPQALARFEREVRATAKLTHWNTIEIFDYGRTEDGTFYYVMEYLPGLSLAELVERHGPLAPERVIHLLAQTCDALAEAHAKGLIHRDIKPGNIFAAQRGGVHDVAKLLDFGLAKPLIRASGVQLTQDGSITGSPLYMSPEQATGDSEPDERSDIYSLGGVAYYLLTGAPPFDGDKPLKVLIAHAHQEVVPPSRLQTGIPDDLERVVMKCLAKSPADRYQSAEALARAFSQCEGAETWTRERAARWWRDNASFATQSHTMVAAI